MHHIIGFKRAPKIPMFIDRNWKVWVAYGYSLFVPPAGIIVISLMGPKSPQNSEVNQKIFMKRFGLPTAVLIVFLRWALRNEKVWVSYSRFMQGTL